METPFGTCPFPAEQNKMVNFRVPDNEMVPPYLPDGEKLRIHMNFAKTGVHSFRRILSLYIAYNAAKCKRFYYAIFTTFNSILQVCSLCWYRFEKYK